MAAHASGDAAGRTYASPYFRNSRAALAVSDA
jgi:hypothetical protein